jgi:omega-6 fatty acid desaturase (delta-12 desaturase)
VPIISSGQEFVPNKFLSNDIKNKTGYNIRKMWNETDLYMKYKSSYQSALKDCGTHFFLLSCAYYGLWFFRDSYMSIITIPLVSLLNVRTFIIFHDCCHDSYTPNKTLNFAIAHITGILTFTSPNWGLDHNIHHLTNGNKNNKFRFKHNELILFTEDEYVNMSSSERWMCDLFYNYRVYYTVFPFLYFFILQRFLYLLKKIKNMEKIPKTLNYIIFNHAVNNAGIVSVLLFVSKNTFLLHFCSCSYFSWILGFVLFHNQHTFNPSYVVDNDTWNTKDSGLLGSSFIQIPIYLKYFSGGIEYHHIHHINAKIPGYNLQKYHEEVVSNTPFFDNIVKVSMLECYTNLKLRLFSETKNRYIRLDEADEIKKD